MDRKEWLRDRQSGVGGTDIASLAGVGFLSPQEVYAEKVAPEPIDRPPSPVMAMGTALEPLNAELYRQRTGRTLLSPGLMRAPEQWLYATFDRLTVDTPESYGGPLELKYTPFFGDDWGDDGTDQVRDGYIVQCTWQLAVLRAMGHAVSAADLAALDSYGNQRVYVIPFDEDLAALLLELGEGFWFRVEHRLDLEDWNPPVCGAIARKLATIHPDTSVQLGPAAAELVEEYETYKSVAKAHTEVADRAKARLVEMLGTNEVGTLPDGRRVRQKLVARKAYTVEASQYTDFRILKPRKGGVSDAVGGVL